MLKSAYMHGLFDEDVWLAMLRDRNSIVHVHDVDGLVALVSTVIDRYVPAFVALRDAVFERYDTELQTIP